MLGSISWKELWIDRELNSLKVGLIADNFSYLDMCKSEGNEGLNLGFLEDGNFLVISGDWNGVMSLIWFWWELFKLNYVEFSIPNGYFLIPGNLASYILPLDNYSLSLMNAASSCC